MNPMHTGNNADPIPDARWERSPDQLTRRRFWAGHAVAVIATGAVLLLRLALDSWYQDRPLLILFMLPIILSAYVGGVWPGIVSTLIAVCGTKFFLIPTEHSLWFERPVDLLQWLLLLAAGVLVSVLSEALHRARRQAVRAAERALNAQAETSRQERRFRALIERGHECVVLVNPELQCIYASPSLQNVEGYAPEELVGRNRSEQTHPDDQLLLRGVHEQILAHPGTPFQFSWRRRHKDGHWLWVEGVAINLLDNPEIGAIVVNYRDISRRKRDEDRIRTQLAHLDLLHQITRAIGQRLDLASVLQVVAARIESQLPVDFSCVCLFDKDTAAMKVVHVGEKSAGLARRIGLTDGQGVPLEGLALCLQGVLVYEPDISRQEFWLHRKLAGAGLRSLVIAPLQADSAVMGVLLAGRLAANRIATSECDFLKQLSEHVALAAHQSQLYAALQQAYDDLRRTQQTMLQQERLSALGQMASGLAHDINNAITPISLYTESLLEREPALSADGRRQLETMRRAIADVSSTVNRITDFCRQQAAPPALAAVDAGDLARQVIDMTRARWHDPAQQRGVKFDVTCDLEPALPTVAGVESELREALINLVYNALDAMSEGGRLTLRGRRCPTDDTAVLLEVSDTGIGMDDTTRRRCIEPFFTTKGTRGTGLGLAMVYGTAQRHHAGLEIDSTPGQGTTVRLRLAVASTAAAQSAATRPAATCPPRHILVVDDDPLLGRALRHLLESDGHRVTLTDGGQAGIAAFAQAAGGGDPVAIVITDLGMPGMDGRAVASAIKAAAPAMPVILLTGWGHGLLADGMVPAHVDRVLNKPPRMEELRAALLELGSKPAAK